MVRGLAIVVTTSVYLDLFRVAVSQDLCSKDYAADVDLSCVNRISSASLLQQRYQKADTLASLDLLSPEVKSAQVCDGVASYDRCWYMSNSGADCDTTCGQHERAYSFARPVEDMTPKLLGHQPMQKQDPWIFLECYDAKEDRYHPYNPNAWGVPEKTPVNELSEAGQHSYPACRLACPCTLELVVSDSTATEATQASVMPNEESDLSTPQARCNDGVGVAQQDRCWYLSEIGASCDSTCAAAQGRRYSFASPIEDVTPKLIGHTPMQKQEPWIFLECYDGKQDRYHPVNPNAWGNPGKTPADELPEAGQHTYPECRLACPCTIESYVSEARARTTLPPVLPTLVTTPPPQAMCNDGVGVAQQKRCWYMSDTGVNCDNTCAAQGRQYSFALPAPDVTPKLIGHEPMQKQGPWIFLECYVDKEDRYHPVNPNAWGVPEKTPANELVEAGQHSYPSCRLACPCNGDLMIAPTTTTTTLLVAVKETTTLTTTTLVLCDDGVGVFAQERCWYLSGTGDNCDTTCVAQGRYYSFAAPAEDMTPKLVGHVPSGRQEPWLFLECYVAKEDRYHSFNPNAWGVPEKTPAGELAEAGQHAYPTCQLACPCGMKTTTTTTTTTPQSVRECSGYATEGRCWYLSAVGASCGDTCAAHNCSYSFGVPPLGDITPQLVGRVPFAREDPWQFVECYNPETDRYYPFNQDVWGVPAKTPLGELSRAGNFTYATCQLSCPCAGSCIGEVTTTTTTTTTTTVESLGVLSCSGYLATDRCWYLSDLGATCADTCAAHSCSYRFAAPPVGDSTPQLLGRVPRNRQSPWMFLECYVPESDRYYPFNQADWNGSSKDSLDQAGQYSHESCRLSCSCAGSCLGDISVPSTSESATKAMSTTITTTASIVTQTCSGYSAGGRCWYLSMMGASCIDTCLSHSCSYSFSEPPSGDIAPHLLGAIPKSRQNPWMFLECYDPGADRYYPFNKIDWGSLANYSSGALAQSGQFSHVSCRLSCPCVGTCVGDVTTPIPPSTTITSTTSSMPVFAATKPVFASTTTTTTTSSNCTGYFAAGRCWYLSELGASCADTCAANGLAYSWAAPPSGKTITPQLLGFEPGNRQNPWAFVECYVPEGDRYHPVSMDAWGVPGKTSYSKVEAALWRNSECRLSCPCVAAAPTCRWVQPPACAPEFEYKGLLYTGCPSVDHDAPWCPHRRQNVGELAIDDWSKCVKMCDDNDPVVDAWNCDWTPPSSCMKEYDYQGSRYVGCTSVDHDSPWCSNSHPFNGSWSHCTYNCRNPSDADARRMAKLNEGASNDSGLCSWKPAAACSPKFVYMGTEYEGCAMFVDHPTPWCSQDPIHSGAWSTCEYTCSNAIS